MDTLATALSLIGTGVAAVLGFASIVWKLGRLRASLEIDFYRVNSRIDLIEHKLQHVAEDVVNLQRLNK